MLRRRWGSAGKGHEVEASPADLSDAGRLTRVIDLAAGDHCLPAMMPPSTGRMVADMLIDSIPSGEAPVWSRSEDRAIANRSFQGAVETRRSALSFLSG